MTSHKQKYKQHQNSIKHPPAQASVTKEAGKLVAAFVADDHVSEKADPVEEMPRALKLRDWLSRTAFSDWCIVVFTLALTICAIFQSLISARQLDAMRKDQRAWIVVDLEPLHPVVGQPLSFTLSIKNSGKTPAIKVHGIMAIQYMPNGATDFALVKVNGSSFTTGIMYPNVSVKQYGARSNQPPDRSGFYPPDRFTQQEAAAMSNHQAWIALHGEIYYEDIFNVKHWVYFCIPTAEGGGSYSFGKCIAYNGVDAN